MNTVRGRAFTVLFAMTMILSAGVSAQEIPPDVWSAARQGLRDFVMIVGMDPKIVPKYPDGTVVSNVGESYLGDPYKPLMISDEAILRCADPSDILKNAKEDGYVFPILNTSYTIAYVAVRFLYVVEEGRNRWAWGNMRLQSEYENKYYELLKAFPPAQGHAVFVISWEHPLDRFFIVRTPAGALQMYPGSKFIADLLDLNKTQVESSNSLDENELLGRLKGISAEHLATKQRLEKETKEWQQQTKDKLEGENEQ